MSCHTMLSYELFPSTNNCIYEMNFYSTSEHYKNCSMFQNSDDIINSITFNNFQTTKPSNSSEEKPAGSSEEFVSEIKEKNRW